MDRLQTMAVFTRVAEMRSFVRAAESLGLPKASVSTAVQRLEERVGSRLLQRTTRRVQLTHDGGIFYERCKDLLADCEEIESMFQGHGQPLQGRIRVDLPSRSARFEVIPALPQFLLEHPGIFLELGTTDRAVDLVREGYDCVLRVGELDASELVGKRLGSMDLWNLASPAYLDRHGTPQRMSDLRKHHLVHFVSTLGQKLDGWEYHDGDAWKMQPMTGRIAVNNSDAYVAACVAGLGIIQAPCASLEAHLAAGRLVEVMPKHRAKPMPVTLLYPHRRNVSRRVRAFTEWLEAVLVPVLSRTRVSRGAPKPLRP